MHPLSIIRGFVLLGESCASARCVPSVVAFYWRVIIVRNHHNKFSTMEDLMAAACKKAVCKNEIKRWDLSHDQTIGVTVATAMADPAGYLCLNGSPSLGDTYNGRSSNTFKVLSIDILGVLARTPIKGDLSAGTPVNELIRLILVVDRQTNFTQMDPATLLYDNGGAGIFSHYDVRYLDRYTVLFDEMFQLNVKTQAHSGDTYYYYEHKPFHIYKRLQLPVYCKTSNQDVGDILDNSLHLLAISYLDGTKSSLEYTSRIRFADSMSAM